MQNETHYTSRDKTTRTAILVIRKSDNKRVGRIVPTNFGYKASFAGVQQTFSTKKAAFDFLVK